MIEEHYLSIILLMHLKHKFDIIIIILLYNYKLIIIYLMQSIIMTSNLFITHIIN